MWCEVGVWKNVKDLIKMLDFEEAMNLLAKADSVIWLKKDWNNILKKQQDSMVTGTMKGIRSKEQDSIVTGTMKRVRSK